MKKSLLTMACLLFFSFFALAQENRIDSNNESIDDKIQQEPTRQTERTIERAATREAKKETTEKKVKETEKVKSKEVKEKTKTTIKKKDKS